MKKIFVFGAVVIVLIAVIKFGGSLMDMVVGEDPGQTSAVTVNAQGDTTPESKVTIEIQNETEETTPESAMAAVDESGIGAQPDGTPVESTQAATEAPTYAITSFSKTMYATRSVHVRAGCSTDTEIVSSLKAGQEVHATGESENGWIRVDYTGKPAYVSKSYLSTTKPVVETKAKATTAPTTAAPAPAPTQAPSPEPAPEPATTPIIVPPPPIG